MSIDDNRHSHCCERMSANTHTHMIEKGAQQQSYENRRSNTYMHTRTHGNASGYRQRTLYVYEREKVRYLASYM